MVPDGWLKGLFQDGVELISGQHVDAGLVNSKGEGKPYLTGPADFKNGYVSATKHTVFGKKFCRQGDLLITVKGSGTGKVVEADGEYAISRQLMAIRPIRFDAKYVYYNLISSVSRFEGASAGLIPGISRNDILHTPILVPPYEEQKRIGQVLEKWDLAITATKKMLANSQQQKKSLMQQLLTGKRRLLDKNGVKFNRDWEVCQLGDWLKEHREKSVKNYQHEVLTSSRDGLMKQSEYFSDSRISQRDNVGFNVIPPGYITYRSRSDDGLFCFNKNEFCFCGIISTYYPVFHFPSGDDDFFLYLLNKSSDFFAAYSVGTSQRVLSLKALKSVKFKIPEKEEQQKIAEVITLAEQEVACFKKKINCLEKEKQALMKQLLTGKRRV